MSGPTEDEFFELGPAQRKCDPLLFLESLLPRQESEAAHATSAAGAQKRRAALGCGISIVDTITVIHGRIRVWLYDSHEGFIVDRKHYDRTSIIASWRQHALTLSPSNSQPTAIVRRTDGRIDIFDVDETVAFVKKLDDELPTVELFQKFIPSRGNDRSIFRVHYSRPPKTEPTIEAIARHPEFLSAERGDRSEYLPIASFNETINSSLESATIKALKHVEQKLKVRFHKAMLEFIVDEDSVPHLLHAHDLMMSDAIGEMPFSQRIAAALSATEAPPPEDNTWKDPVVDTRLDTTADVTLISPNMYGVRLGSGLKGEILLVETDERVAAQVVDALVSEGFIVTVLDDGAQALSLSRSQVYDAVILSRDLKSLSGLEVARILRQREMHASAKLSEGDRLPILVFTDKTAQEDLKLYREGGFSGCISKPFARDSFIKSILTAVPRPTRSQGVVRPVSMAWKAATQAKDLPEGISETASMEEHKGPETERYQGTRRTQGGTAGLTSTGLSKKSPYELPVATLKQQSVKLGTMATAGSTIADSKTDKADDAHHANTASLSKVAPPVAAGRHGGRLGMGAGANPHTADHQAVKQGAKKTDNIHIDTFRLDAETEIPYCVLGKRREGASFFHLIIVHDMFDTYERFQLLLERITASLNGLRILLFNYPGQAFTQFRKDVVLNNEYHAGCLQALLVHLGAAGTRAFDFDDGHTPFFIMGYGNGGSIASAFVAKYADIYVNLRGLVLVNGFVTPDAHAAGVLHDCINVFSCTPPQRPDLPIYFYARYLFCAPYLEKVGAPLALNMYTAVANPITLDGRIALCNGALSHANIFNDLNKMEIPVIAVVSTRDSFIKPLHTKTMAKARGGEARSIRRTLYAKRQVAVIELPAGHEVFQECKQTMLNLVVQLVTGYHEKNDVAFVPMEENEMSMLAPEADVLAASKAGGAVSKSKVKAVSSAVANEKHLLGETDKGALLLEDRFLDHVVTSMRNPAVLTMYPDDAAALEATYKHTTGTIPVIPSGAAQAFTPRAKHNPAVANSSVLHSLMPEMKLGSSGMLSLDASHAAGGAAQHTSRYGMASPRPAGGGYNDVKRSLPPLRRLDNEEAIAVTSKMARLGVGQSGSGETFRLSQGLQESIANSPGADASSKGKVVAPDSQYTTAAQEFMKWRVIRNRRRLQRIEACAITIQRAWRQYLARTAVRRIVEHRAALDIQRFWRGVMGRAYAKEVKRIINAVKAVQRVYRGHLVRKIARRLRVENAAAAEIQRIWKGYTIRRYIAAMKQRFIDAAIRIQCCWRRFAALKELVRRRIERVAATTLQRVIRGFLARRRATRERERFLFSKSQAQGIEFGRQLLMEHKLKATRLQSEVSTLTREKVLTEEQIHGLLTEVASLEQSVRQLEKDMAKLSRMDAQVALAMDEQARIELRENKVRLDKEFASMLEKISDRKNQLTLLENKLQSLTRAKDSKSGELKDLERKLIILLEQQQNELQAIRHRQERRGENMIEDAVTAVKLALTGGDPSQLKSGALALDDLDRHAGGGAGMYALENGSDPVHGALVRADATHRPRGFGGGGAGDTVDFNDLPSAGGTRRSRHDGSGGMGGPTPQQRAEAAALMASTETMMKFGFMAMSMTYFSSLNMVKSMKQLGTANTLLASNPLLQTIANYGAAGMAGAGPVAALPQMATGGANSLKAGATASGGDVSVMSWTVADVGAWLEVLTLGQYKESFAEAAIDGAFLVELTDDDLQNSLGIEHPLHRKKIVAAIVRLQKEQAERDAIEAAKNAAAVNALSGGGYGSSAAPSTGTSRSAADAPGAIVPRNAAAPLVRVSTANPALRARERQEADAAQKDADKHAGFLKLDELISWIRHDKVKQVTDALSALPDSKFKQDSVSKQYVANYGTEYTASLRGAAFHINKADDKGNTLLIVAAQNDRMKLAQLLVQKGANPDHQNALGNTALHYAMAYKHRELASWLVNPEKAAANDELRNIHNLDPYEGLE